MESAVGIEVTGRIGLGQADFTIIAEATYVGEEGDVKGMYLLQHDAGGGVTAFALGVGDAASVLDIAGRGVKGMFDPVLPVGDTAYNSIPEVANQLRVLANKLEVSAHAYTVAR